MSLAFFPTEPLLAGSDLGGNIVLYNIPTMEVVHPPLKAHTSRVMSLAFSPDGRTLAAACEGGGLKLWSLLQDPEMLAAIQEAWASIEMLAALPAQAFGPWPRMKRGTLYRVTVQSPQQDAATSVAFVEAL
jgi:WD40 repeat protein